MQNTLKLVNKDFKKQNKGIEFEIKIVDSSFNVLWMKKGDKFAPVYTGTEEEIKIALNVANNIILF